MMKKIFFLFPVTLILFSLMFCNNAGTTGQKTASGRETSEENFQPTGMIAYIRNGAEIRLIDSNGQNDRLLWSHPNAKNPLGLFDLAWRPDGRELAFSSAHESAYSLYHADIFCIRPDGSGFRKITNAPDRKGFSQYKKGTVTITVKNLQYSFDPAQSSYGTFILNIIGAEEPQQITLPPGASKTVTFKNVADFGATVQPVVAIFGNYRWYMPGTDVEAGKTIKAPDMIISGDGYPYFGAFRPVWKYDGSVISYRDGLCAVKTIPAQPPVGEFYYKPLFKEDHPLGSCVWDWGPTAALANQILYTENESDEGSGIFLMKEGGTHDPASRLTLFSNVRHQIANELKWLPDGSGFLYSHTAWNEQGKIVSNIFRYDINTKQTTQVTRLENAYARRFSISPSGQWIVYERCFKDPKDDDSFGIDISNLENVDLWLIRPDGTDEKLLVKNAQGPSWSR